MSVWSACIATIDGGAPPAQVRADAPHPSCSGLTRSSVDPKKRAKCWRKPIRGSSPRMTGGDGPTVSVYDGGYYGRSTHAIHDGDTGRSRGFRASATPRASCAGQRTSERSRSSPARTASNYGRTSPPRVGPESRGDNGGSPARAGAGFAAWSLAEALRTPPKVVSDARFSAADIQAAMSTMFGARQFNV